MHWPGIEPGPPAWQARILPLNHQCLHYSCTYRFFHSFLHFLGRIAEKQRLLVLVNAYKNHAPD